MYRKMRAKKMSAIEKAQKVVKSIVAKGPSTVADTVQAAAHRNVPKADAEAATYMMLSSGQIRLDSSYRLKPGR